MSHSSPNRRDFFTQTISTGKPLLPMPQQAFNSAFPGVPSKFVLYTALPRRKIKRSNPFCLRPLPPIFTRLESALFRVQASISSLLYTALCSEDGLRRAKRGIPHERDSVAQVLHVVSAAHSLFEFRAFAVTCMNSTFVQCHALPNAKEVVFDEPKKWVGIYFSTVDDLLRASCSGWYMKGSVSRTKMGPRGLAPTIYVAGCLGETFHKSILSSRFILPCSSGPESLFQRPRNAVFMQSPVRWVEGDWTEVFEEHRHPPPHSIESVPVSSVRIIGRTVDPRVNPMPGYTVQWLPTSRVLSHESLSRDERSMGLVSLTLPFVMIHSKSLVDSIRNVLFT